MVKLVVVTVDLTATFEKKIEKELCQVKRNKNLKTEFKAIEIDLLNAYEGSPKLIELVDKSQRNSLRIDAIKEGPNDTWEVCEKKPKYHCG